jgi:hypothetical protein
MGLVGVARLERRTQQRAAPVALGQHEKALEAVNANQRGRAVAHGALEAPTQLAPAEPMRKRTPQRSSPGVAGAFTATVAGPATISCPASKTMSAHASGRTRSARSCDIHTHARWASRPGGGANSR